MSKLSSIQKIISSNGEEYPSPGSIGGKIRRIRELLGLTQKEVGKRCGFPDSSADVRIRQYESNQKIPRKEAMDTICDALNIHKDSLFDADLNSTTRMYHALFDIEDFHGLHPVEIDGKYYLEFSGPTLMEGNVECYEQDDFLKKWMEMREKYLPDPKDDDDAKKKKQKEYDIWRYQYPMNGYWNNHTD